MAFSVEDFADAVMAHEYGGFHADNVTFGYTRAAADRTQRHVPFFGDRPTRPVTFGRFGREHHGSRTLGWYGSREGSGILGRHWRQQHYTPYGFFPLGFDDAVFVPPGSCLPPWECDDEIFGAEPIAGGGAKASSATELSPSGKTGAVAPPSPPPPASPPPPPPPAALPPHPALEVSPELFAMSAGPEEMLAIAVASTLDPSLPEAPPEYMALVRGAFEAHPRTAPWIPEPVRYPEYVPFVGHEPDADFGQLLAETLEHILHPPRRPRPFLRRGHHLRPIGF